MANETANRSHAGLVFQAYPNKPPEIARGSWGVQVNDVTRVAAVNGLYLVRLSQPLSSVLNDDVDGVAALDGIVLFSPAGRNPEVRVSLSPDFLAGPPASTPGARLALPFILIAIFEADVPANVIAAVNIEVRRSPED